MHHRTSRLGSFELIRQGYRDAIVLNTVGVFTRKALSFKTSRRKLPAELSSGMPQTINLCAEPLGLFTVKIELLKIQPIICTWLLVW